MYQVLLVDDEENTIDILLNTIQWQELGVEMLYTARDGKQALEIFEKQSIDLIITDIKMPYMDGISLIEKVKSIKPQVKCILLTAHSEFEYAKKAIVLKVENYLLKPVIKSELEQTVENALDSLYENRYSETEQLRENILRRWLSGNISSEELGERAEILKLNLYLPQYCAICIMKTTTLEITSLLTSYERLLAEHNDVYSFWNEKGVFVIIVGGKEIQLKSLSQELEQLTLKKEAEDKVRIAVGDVVYDAGFLHLSYKKACDNMELFKVNQSCVVWQNDYMVANLKTEYLIEEIRFLMFCNNPEMRNHGYKRLIVKLYKESKDENTNSLLTHLWSICMKVLATEFPHQADSLNKNLCLLYPGEAVLPKEEFIKEAEILLRQAQQSFDQAFGQISPIVQKACRYVRDCVLSGESCSIKEFCVKNNMNAAYLGHIYKKETGKFFNDYLLQCRINRSIVLLYNPTNRIKEIARIVGFSSVSYYVQRFRECKGVSPEKYRSMDWEG